MTNSTTAPLTGPEIVPDTVNSAIVLCHGYGSNGQDLHGISQQIHSQFPDTAFLSPNAPEACPGSPGGYQWFALPELTQNVRDEGTQRAAPVLNAYLDHVQQRFGLPGEKVALLGFSQGTMMSLHVGLRRPCAGILGYSGAMAAPAQLKHEIHKPVPVMLIHGTHDQVLPIPLMFQAMGALEANDIPVSHHISHNVPHSIGPDGLQKGVAFLKSLLQEMGS